MRSSIFLNSFLLMIEILLWILGPYQFFDCFCSSSQFDMDLPMEVEFVCFAVVF